MSNITKHHRGEVSKLEKIELPQLPQELRRAVEGELTYASAKLLGCTKSGQRKTILYRAFTKHGTILTVWTAYCGDTRLEGEVFENSMAVSEIKFFLENSDLFR